ncbi:MAG TPA: ABC transporter permease [Candidatus Angelobacter sp.]|nr:ABC transporter permease [Candidatus Angelobacter sp.]
MSEAIRKAPELEGQPAVWDSASVAAGFLRDTWALADVELRKLRRDPTELLTRAIQPALWLLVFGQVFSRTKAIPTGGLDYLTFMTPGILAQSVLFIAIFYGISVIWERDLGILQKLLVSPAPRTALVLGKALSAGVRGLAQGVIIYSLALMLRIRLDFRILHVLGVAGFIILGSALFSTFSLAVACMVKTRERFMGIGQVLTMPLFFASNAIYPIANMPPWVSAIAKANPLSYQVDALRSLMVQGGSSIFGIGVDTAVLLLIFVALVLVTAALYPNVVR